MIRRAVVIFLAFFAGAAVAPAWADAPLRTSLEGTGWVVDKLEPGAEVVCDLVFGVAPVEMEYFAAKIVR